MTTFIYELSLAKPRADFGKPTVHFVNAQGTSGHLVTVAGERFFIVPNLHAVREALPHYYRKALDRSPNMWFDYHNPDNPCWIYLRDYRNKYLNTVICTLKEIDDGKGK
ncbi:hypothetical protein [Rhizobium phage RHph_X3_9]|nr:hypothetical protein [Rhizobium phage RHph_X3_9]